MSGKAAPRRGLDFTSKSRWRPKKVPAGLKRNLTISTASHIRHNKRKIHHLHEHAHKRLKLLNRLHKLHLAHPEVPLSQHVVAQSNVTAQGSVTGQSGRLHACKNVMFYSGLGFEGALSKPGEYPTTLNRKVKSLLIPPGCLVHDDYTGVTYMFGAPLNLGGHNDGLDFKWISYSTYTSETKGVFLMIRGAMTRQMKGTAASYDYYGGKVVTTDQKTLTPYHAFYVFGGSIARVYPAQSFTGTIRQKTGVSHTRGFGWLPVANYDVNPAPEFRTPIKAYRNTTYQNGANSGKCLTASFGGSVALLNCTKGLKSQLWWKVFDINGNFQLKTAITDTSGKEEVACLRAANRGSFGSKDGFYYKAMYAECGSDCDRKRQVEWGKCDSSSNALWSVAQTGYHSDTEMDAPYEQLVSAHKIRVSNDVNAVLETLYLIFDCWDATVIASGFANPSVSPPPPDGPQQYFTGQCTVCPARYYQSCRDGYEITPGYHDGERGCGFLGCELSCTRSGQPSPPPPPVLTELLAMNGVCLENDRSKSSPVLANGMDGYRQYMDVSVNHPSMRVLDGTSPQARYSTGSWQLAGSAQKIDAGPAWPVVTYGISTETSETEEQSTALGFEASTESSAAFSASASLTTGASMGLKREKEFGAGPVELKRESTKTMGAKASASTEASTSTSGSRTSSGESSSTDSAESAAQRADDLLCPLQCSLYSTVHKPHTGSGARQR
jgi:hypothetical protein